MQGISRMVIFNFKFLPLYIWVLEAKSNVGHASPLARPLETSSILYRALHCVHFTANLSALALKAKGFLVWWNVPFNITISNICGSGNDRQISADCIKAGSCACLGVLKGLCDCQRSSPPVQSCSELRPPPRSHIS